MLEILIALVSLLSPPPFPDLPEDVFAPLPPVQAVEGYLAPPLATVPFEPETLLCLTGAVEYAARVS